MNEPRSKSWPHHLDSEDGDSKKVPQDAADLFNVDDNDVEMASRATSVPLTSDVADSSGYNITYDLGNRVDDSESPSPKAVSRKRGRSVVPSNDSSSEEEQAVRVVKKLLKRAKVGFQYYGIRFTDQLLG